MKIKDVEKAELLISDRKEALFLAESFRKQEFALSKVYSLRVMATFVLLASDIEKEIEKL